MTRSELTVRMARRHRGRLAAEDVENAVRNIVEQMSGALARGDRIEIRGFGSFRLQYWRPRWGRNPATGEPVKMDGSYVPRFRPGKRLRERVDEAWRRELGGSSLRPVGSK